MPEKRLGIRDILAHNLKENRRKLGLTQEKLSEKAGISAHYPAMVEVACKFPTPEMLDTLAEALEIETYQLFDVSATPEGTLLHLEKSILDNINNQQQQMIAEMKETVINAVKESLRETKNEE